MKEKTYFEILEEMEQDKLKKFDPQTALGALCARVVKRLQDDEQLTEDNFIIPIKKQLYDTTKNEKKTRGTYIIEIEDETRYIVEFKQTFTIDEIKAKNLEWLLDNPMVELKEVTE